MRDVSNAVDVEKWEIPTSGGKANTIECKLGARGCGSY
jgi:hypothetical protein